MCGETTRRSGVDNSRGLDHLVTYCSAVTVKFWRGKRCLHIPSLRDAASCCILSLTFLYANYRSTINLTTLRSCICINIALGNVATVQSKI